MELLKLKEVTSGYKDVKVLHSVNLTVNSNDFIGVIGPNGGGKTTLLRLILGLLKPWKGDVTYGRELIRQGRIQIGYVPQDPGLDFRFPLSVKDVVRSGTMNSRALSIWSKPGKKVSYALDLVGMLERKNCSFGELSGGQRQKVLLARSIADDPALLVLDEPDTYTDQRFESELYDLLLELNKRMAIIMVSHDLGIISSHVKSIACVNGGLHYHASNVISKEMLDSYECPIDIITHGDLPHRVLGEH